MLDDKIKATQINVTQQSNDININKLLNMLLTIDKYKVTEFDTPTSGDVTETIKLKSDDSIYATIITEFDTPTSGDITETIVCTDLNINNSVITEFDTPTSGDITETGGA